MSARGHQPWPQPHQGHNPSTKPGQLRELIDQIPVSHLLVHALESTESLP
jgi:hypothetical protein